MLKRILFLTFYFEPDLCAGSFRNTPLARTLAVMAGKDVEVHVITTQPNRYNSFRVKSEAHERNENLLIDRIELPAHKSGFGDQIQAFRKYYNGALKLTRSQHYDLVFASSSRIFTAYLGKKIADKKNIPLYLDIRDIFVDTMADVLQNPVVNKAVTFSVKNFIEKPTFRYAKHINLISEGFKPYFDSYNNTHYSYFPNGIDDEFYGLKQNENLGYHNHVVTYAGNIGEGQGLHKIIPAAAKMLGDKYRFRIIGDGGTRRLLEEELIKNKVTNVELIQPMNRKQILEEYKNSHFLFLHLNDYEAFKKVLPSKIFEYGATNIPMIAGVAGYASSFIKENVSNSLVFQPCDAEEMVTLLNNYKYRLEEREHFTKNFSRSAVNEKMAASILSYL